jgi:hypothetical protein
MFRARGAHHQERSNCINKASGNCHSVLVAVSYDVWDWLRLFSSQTFSLTNNPTFLKPSHSSQLPAYDDGTGRVFRNVGI